MLSCKENKTVVEEKPKTPFVWEGANLYFLLTDRFNNGDTSNDVNFDRTKEQDQWLYYGCSIKGWEILMKKNGYLPVAISNSGVNVFFVKESLIKEKKDIIDIDNSFVDYNWPNNLTHEDQWVKIKNMNYNNIV